jgi:hypothetical protein
MVRLISTSLKLAHYIKYNYVVFIVRSNFLTVGYLIKFKEMQALIFNLT